MRVLIVLGMASLALSLSASSGFAGKARGGERGVKHYCRELVRAKYCGGEACSPGTPAQAQAKAAHETCVQNRGTL